MGVWLFESMVPLPSMKLSKCGINSRSDGTFGLSRKKWTLSKVISITCETPLPSEQVVDVAVLAVGAVTVAVAPAFPAVSAADRPTVDVAATMATDMRRNRLNVLMPFLPFVTQRENKQA